jgi:hypothetical protein
MFGLGLISTRILEIAEGVDVQVHHLISLGGWTNVTFIYLSIYLSIQRPQAVCT